MKCVKNLCPRPCLFSGLLLCAFLFSFALSPGLPPWNCSTALAADPAPATPAAPSGPGATIIKKGAPLNITSDRLEANQKDKTIIFDGHVVVVQDDLTITGNRMTVHQMESNDPNASTSAMMNKIDRVEVEGSVNITQQGRVATAEKAVYYQGEQKIVLLGNPVVTQGEDSVKGRMITLFLAEERSIVEGGGEAAPVQAIIHPDKNKSEQPDKNKTDQPKTTSPKTRAGQ